MKFSSILLTGLMLTSVVGVQAQDVRTDTLVAPKLSGTFQGFDAVGHTVRISNIDYAVSPAVSGRDLTRLRELRTGAKVNFSVSGYDPKGRDVISGITIQ